MPTAPDTRALLATVHDSVLDVASADWRAIVDEAADLAMDRRLIAVQERTLEDQCRIWTVIMRDDAGRPAACACLCLFRVDGALSARPLASGAVDLVRRAWPGLLRFNVLFCGLPAPAGESHVRIAPDVDASAVMACLNTVMRQLATEHSAMLIVLKEFGDEQSEHGAWLTERRYLEGAIPPMHRLRGEFRDFDEFLSRMRSRYRAQVQRSRRKIESGSLSLSHHCRPSEIDQLFTPQLHGLYDAVWRRSAYRLEWLPLEFFREAARRMNGQARLTLIRRRGTPVGFTFSMACGAIWHNMYSGVDYAINGEGDVLFNLFYADLAQAFEAGCTDIRLGQTSDTFKARLGAVAEPLRFFVRARSPVLHAGLRAFSVALFPEVPESPASHVFKDTRFDRDDNEAFGRRMFATAAAD